MTRKERPPTLRRVCFLLVTLLAAGCVKETTSPRGGTGGSGTATATGGSGSARASGGSTGTGTGGGGLVIDNDAGIIGGSGSGSADTATTPPMTCASIRNCVTACKDDAACKQRCPTQAPTAAKNEFNDIVTCAKAMCPDLEETCRCEAECLAGGACATLVDECRAFEDDVFCDINCH